METNPFRVNATGCSLVDNLYGKVSFDTDAYRRLSSRTAGDGGLVTGGLTFSEALAVFADESESAYPALLSELAGGSGPDSSNIGGPGIVPMIHAAQVRRNPGIRYRFSGVFGRDENGRRFRELMERAGFPMDDYALSGHPTPSTDVLSDPSFDGGRGERTFINTIGAAGSFGPESLPDDFFDAELLLFGATALVPPLHDALEDLCRRGREAGAFVMVNTVFDFRNEARMKGRPWPLVEDYGNIDILAADREESLKISGKASPEEALEWFLDRGCGAAVVTQGAGDVLLGAGPEGPFEAPSRSAMPTCRYADEVVSELDHPRDTTGCGDNFVGGLLDSIAHQMASRRDGGGGRPAPRKSADGSGEAKGALDLGEAVISGVAAGSAALSCLGGVFYEDEPGHKLGFLTPYLEAYRRELREPIE